jgi:hypothetical protein
MRRMKGFKKLLRFGFCAVEQSLHIDMANASPFQKKDLLKKHLTCQHRYAIRARGHARSFYLGNRAGIAPAYMSVPIWEFALCRHRERDLDRVWEFALARHIPAYLGIRAGADTFGNSRWRKHIRALWLPVSCL